MSSWLYDPVADLAFQSDDPPGTCPCRASRLTRFAFLPTTSGLARVSVKAPGYALGCLSDPFDYRPLGTAVKPDGAMLAALDAEWAAVAVARAGLVATNGGGR